MVIDKIRSILKKDDEIQAPKELPDLLYEQNSENSSKQEQLTVQPTVQSNQPTQQEVKPEVKKEPIQTPTPTPQAQQTPTSQYKPKVETTEDSVNLIDEDLGEINEELQETPIEQKQIERQPVTFQPKPYEPKPLQEVKQIAEQKPQPTQPPIQKEQPQQSQPVESKQNVNITINNSGFFNKLGNLMSDENHLKELLEQDLFESMRVYHKKQELGEQHFFHVSEIEKAIKEKLVSLQVLEDEWLMEKKKLQEQEKMFMAKEEELFGSIEDLKGLFTRLETVKKLKEDLPENQQFKLSNGEVVKSIHELKILLPVIPDEVFYNHINEQRNDFADWVEHVYNSSELTQKVRDSKTKQDLLEKLVDY